MPGMKSVWFSVVVLQCLPLLCTAELLINVQNQGGEIVQETITSNVSEDIITLEFQRTDGTLVTELIDFHNEVHVLKALVLGEEERGQSQYQVMCFVTKLQRGDFISSDAMAKLRQKNPNTIRTPEEDRGKENSTMSGWLVVDKASLISRHIPGMCQEAAESTYVRDSDLRLWAEMPGSSQALLAALVVPFPASTSRCRDVSGLWAPCTCTLELCIGWYPCELKYCKGKVADGAETGTSYRCGIKTCRRCNQFAYYVGEKQQCLWDE